MFTSNRTETFDEFSYKVVNTSHFYQKAKHYNKN